MRTALFVPFRSICFVRVPFYAQFFILPQHSDDFSRILRKRRIFPDFTHSDSDILQIYRDVVDKWCISARFRFYIIPRNSLAAEDRNIFYEIVSYVKRVLNRSAYDFLLLADLFHLFHFMQRVLQSPRRKSCDTRQSLFHFMLHAISLLYILKRTVVRKDAILHCGLIS